MSEQFEWLELGSFVRKHQEKWPAGSGKTTLARLFVQERGLRHIELDNLYWLPNWGQCTSEEFKIKVKAATQGDNWVACGNYRIVKEYVMEQADLVIWLDYPFWRVFSQILRRTIKNTYKLRSIKWVVMKYEAILKANPELFYHWKLGITY